MRYSVVPLGLACPLVSQAGVRLSHLSRRLGFFRRNAPHWVLRGLLSDVWFQDEPVLRTVRNLVGGSRALTQLDQY